MDVILIGRIHEWRQDIGRTGDWLWAYLVLAAAMVALPFVADYFVR